MAMGGRLGSVEELEAIRAGEVPGKTLEWSVPASPPAWVPWPTTDGYWWARDPVVGSLCIVEARVYPEGSHIYFTGVECPLYANEPREAWEFTPAIPPRMER